MSRRYLMSWQDAKAQSSAKQVARPNGRGAMRSNILTKGSKTRAQRGPDMGHPCLMPLSISKAPMMQPQNLT
eukprot:6656776-Lingulodinium_polyedra.AAC.1